ncbi:AMP-binding protein [Dactylosporangium sp. NPDC050688]|uniref:AMP-binding protein n=1 Tax=Dactylosporangium sp. NPDC050688 TaxID=3157217 RepID=UPI0033DB111A
MTVTAAAVGERLAAIAAEQPDAAAAIDATGSLSWRRLAAQTTEVAGRLRAALPPDAGQPVVAVPAATTAATLPLLLGVLAAGLPLLPVDPRAPTEERDTLLRFVARSYGPVHVLTDTALSAVSDMTPGDSRPEVGLPGAGRRAGYLLTSGGSSGLIKVIAVPGPIRHDPRTVPSPLLRRAGWQSGQRQLICGPLHHTAPFTATLDGILDANTLILLPAFAPDLLVELIRAESVAWMQLTPAHMRSVVQLTDAVPADFASVTGVLHTAAACDFATKKAWIELVGAHRIAETYGSTEAVGVTFARGDEWLARPGTVGRGFLTQLRILDEAGRRLPPGDVGTVYMRSGRMSARSTYLGGLSLPTTPDGFATVGDHGWLDEDGYLFLTPRRTDLINVGGENVYPAEVEAVLMEHPAVADAAAVGGADAILGAVVHANVVLVGPNAAGRPELVRHCAARLSPHKVPRTMTFVASVPRSAAGKLERWRMTGGDPA